MSWTAHYTAPSTAVPRAGSHGNTPVERAGSQVSASSPTVISREQILMLSFWQSAYRLWEFPYWICLRLAWVGRTLDHGHTHSSLSTSRSLYRSCRGLHALSAEISRASRVTIHQRDCNGCLDVTAICKTGSKRLTVERGKPVKRLLADFAGTRVRKISSGSQPRYDNSHL